MRAPEKIDEANEVRLNLTLSLVELSFRRVLPEELFELDTSEYTFSFRKFTPTLPSIKYGNTSGYEAKWIPRNHRLRDKYDLTATIPESRGHMILVEALKRHSYEFEESAELDYRNLTVEGFAENGLLENPHVELVYRD